MHGAVKQVIEVVPQKNEQRPVFDWAAQRVHATLHAASLSPQSPPLKLLSRSSVALLSPISQVPRYVL